MGKRPRSGSKRQKSPIMYQKVLKTLILQIKFFKNEYTGNIKKNNIKKCYWNVKTNLKKYSFADPN